MKTVIIVLTAFFAFSTTVIAQTDTASIKNNFIEKCCQQIK
jgi:hypothetical protein